MNVRKEFKAVVLLLVCLVLLVSCTSAPTTLAPTTAATTAATTAGTTAVTTAGTTAATTKATTAAPAPRKLTLLGAVDEAFYKTWDTQSSMIRYRELLKAANIDLQMEAIVQPQWATVIQTRLASASLPDLIFLGGVDIATILQLGKSGKFIDVLPMVEKYSNGNWKKLSDKFKMNLWGASLSTDGKAYFLPGYYTMFTKAGELYSSPYVPMVRYDWVKKLGLQLPTTIDELSALLKAFRDKDANGNGKKDEVLLFNPTFNTFGPLFGMPHQHYGIDPQDHVVKSPWLMKDKLVNYVKWLQDMTASGVLAKDAIGQTGEYTTTMLKSNIVSCQTGWNGTGFYDPPVAEFGGIYLGVATPYDKKDYYIYGIDPGNVSNRTAITNTCKDVEAAIDLFDLTFTEEMYIMARFGVPGIGHKVVDGLAMPVDGLGNRDWDLKGGACLATLTGAITPLLRVEYFEQFYLNLGSDPALQKLRFDFGMKYGPVKASGEVKYYYMGINQIAIMPDADQLRLKTLKTDLDTYMNETLTKLAIGDYKIADIDTHINKIKGLGIEEVLSIYQKAHNKYIGK